GTSAGDLARACRVAIYFRGAGVAIYSRENEQRMALERFLYHPDELAGIWYQRRPGLTFGAISILAAALARCTLSPSDFPLFIAVGRALAAIRENHDIGRGLIKGRVSEEMLATFENGVPVERLARTLHPPASRPTPSLPEGTFRTAFPRTVLGVDDEHGTPRESNLLQDVTGPGYEYVVATAMQIVVRGVARTLDSAPKARYEGFLTVDREEIERINEIRRLITSYRASESDRRPLSLAVFGPPGSGKSFAIKQVAADLFGQSQAALEFNLSQLVSREDLHAAFDQVRDATVRGKIPLVFWDEFDTGGLVWLKEFLAPMQDSEFRADGIPHPFGKVIFIFAGGTCSTFGDFDRSASSETAGEQFRLAKGSDFVSRLRGYVNIKGPNPTVPGGDIAHVIRRAILLRSLLERSYPHLIDVTTGTAAISASVVRGFLRAAKFYHGARSLESIVSMSALVGTRHYGVTELPSPELLGLHVTPDFNRWVREGELEETTIELLAEAEHRAWLGERRRDGWVPGPERDDERKVNPLLVDYNVLQEADRERNRHSARVTLAKLQQIGYRIEPISSGPEGPLRTQLFTDIERTRLAAIEHHIWLRDRLLRGYSYAAHTDERLRLHPDVAPFESQSESEQRLSAAKVDVIASALRAGGYVLVRTTRGSDRVAVGVSGHRTLADTEKLVAGVREAIVRIQSAYGHLPLTAVSMLAEGADRLAVEEILRIDGSQHVAILPFSRAEFAQEFGPAGSPSRLHFDALLERASEVVELAQSRTIEDGFLRAGHSIVDRCDVLVAIWDGAEAQGRGGTAQVVAYARQQGKPIVVVRAGNRHPNNGAPSTLGQDQGELVVEGLA
ncbi:MAG TPA: RyR domain-containing protein, partial [Chloroflexota bacterium]|nr:RyR domain-containing protein [Chloroflexota bacterium]